jgi:hypothetical protein
MLNRIEPQMPVQGYKTYGLTYPLKTHWKKATCEQVDCEAYIYGWVTSVDVSSDLGREQADYIRRHSGRSFTETNPGVFQFKAGQTCFRAADHRLKLEREPLFVVRHGDYRGNPDGWKIQHDNGANWQEDFAEHQDIITARIERG